MSELPMREELAELFRRHHRNACYPHAEDFEALIFADAAISAMAPRFVQMGLDAAAEVEPKHKHGPALTYDGCVSDYRDAIRALSASDVYERMK